MSTLKNILLSAVMAIAFMSAKAAESSVAVEISNPISLERAMEMVEIPLESLEKKLGTASGFIVTDADGREVPSQLTYDGKLIFQASVGARSKSVYHVKQGTPAKYETQVEEDGGESVRCEVNFHSTVKYLSSTALEYARMENSFGSLTVYFTDCILWQHQADVKVDISFAAAELYIPSSWHVICNVFSSFGSINEHGSSSPASEEVLTITGDVSFGSLEIHYI